MYVSDQLLKVNIFIADNGFISILKHMPMSLMTDIIGYGISGKKPSHEPR